MKHHQLFTKQLQAKSEQEQFMYEVKRDRVENELRVREAERKKLGDYVVEDESLLKRC